MGPNHKFLLDIIANQKTPDEKQETRHHKHIEANDKALGEIKGNITANTTNIKGLRDWVKKLELDLATMQKKYDETQKLLGDASTNVNAYATTGYQVC